MKYSTELMDFITVLTLAPKEEIDPKITDLMKILLEDGKMDSEAMEGIVNQCMEDTSLATDFAFRMLNEAVYHMCVQEIKEASLNA